MIGRAGSVFDLSVLLAEVDLHVGELGQVLGDRVGEQELALLEEDHHRRRGHRLGSASRAGRSCRAVIGVPAGDVARPDGAEVHDLAAARDQRHHAGQVAGVDVALHGGGDAREPLARDTDVLRLGQRAGLVAGGEGGGRRRTARSTRVQAAARRHRAGTSARFGSWRTSGRRLLYRGAARARARQARYNPVWPGLLRAAIGNNLSTYLSHKIWRPFGMDLRPVPVDRPGVEER